MKTLILIAFALFVFLGTFGGILASIAEKMQVIR